MTEELRVFVYGTLKKGGSLNGALHDSELLGEFQTEEVYTMINLGWYPGVLRNGSTSIHGEVYSITPDIFKNLDRTEGYPTLYTREEIDTPYGVAWIYTYNAGRVTNTQPVIPSGIWINRGQ